MESEDIYRVKFTYRNRGWTLLIKLNKKKSYPLIKKVVKSWKRKVKSNEDEVDVFIRKITFEMLELAHNHNYNYNEVKEHFNNRINEWFSFNENHGIELTPDDPTAPFLPLWEG